MRGNPWYRMALELTPGADLRALAGTLVLLGLERGPRTVAELPRAWPVTRVVVRAAASQAVAAGLVETDGTPGRRMQLTSRGHAALAGLRGRQSAA